ncbi:acyltransferase [Candidatus Thorarchaeota archaeon]|nr:MAG: acyltransferase [Candidatus Thorarchaeota archaeon]
MEIFTLTEKRESWIALTKAIALILVIFIHCLPRDAFNGFLTGFVMPSFFILYGVTHNSGKYRDNLKQYLLNRGRSLMIPYFILNLIIFAMYAVAYPTIDYGFPPLDYVYWFIYGNGPLGRVTHLWFLRTMFFAIVLFSVIDRYLHNKSVIFRFIIAAVSPGIGVLLKFSTGVELVPWGMDAVLIALSFMLIGSEIRKHHHVAPWSKNKRADLVGLILAFAIYTYLSTINEFVNIGKSVYGNFIYSYIITGVVGTYLVGLLSYYACKRFVSLQRYADAYNQVGQEVYETHPLIIETNVQLFGDLALAGTLYQWPRAPLFIFNFPLAIIISYLLATKVISRSSVLQFIFLGFRKPKDEPIKQAFPVPEPNENNDDEVIEGMDA